MTNMSHPQSAYVHEVWSDCNNAAAQCVTCGHAKGYHTVGRYACHAEDNECTCRLFMLVKPMRHVDPWDAAAVAAEDRRDAYLEEAMMNPIFEEILFEIPEDYVFPTRPMFTAKNYTVIAEMLRGVGDTFVSRFLAVLQSCAEEIGDEDERRGYLDDLLTRIGVLHGWMVTVQGFGDLFVHDNERFNWIAFKEAVKYDEVAAVRAQGINYYQGEK